MSLREGIAVQISTYPMDARHIRTLLPHQIRAWSAMVDHIVVTIDTHRSSAGRYRGDHFSESLAALRRGIDDVRKSHPRLQVIDVDYSPSVQRSIARFFFNADSMPIKAWDGGPFYAYFFGLYVANARHVMHFDGDMMFGGGSTTWIQEAIACMQQRRDVLMTAPLPGPPPAVAAKRGHRVLRDAPLRVEKMPFAAYRYKHVSTRAFLVDLNRFKGILGAFPTLRPSIAQRLKSRLLGNPPDALEAEQLLSRTMQQSNLYRIDLLGSGSGMWSLHPPFRSEEFYRRLPELVRAVERGSVPDGQRGDYDLNDSMIDWTDARAENHWRRRYTRILRQRLELST